METLVNSESSRGLHSASRVFKILELVDNVIEFAHQENDQVTGDIGTLSKIARVNKFLSSIALPKMWRSLLYPEPLFSLLPKDLVETAGALQPLSTSSYGVENIERFLFYSALIRSVVLTKLSHSVRIFSFVAELVDVLGLQQMQLQNLKTLVIDAQIGLYPETWSHFWRSLNAEMLEELRVSIYGMGCLIQAQEFGGRCPNLKSFAIESTIDRSLIETEPALLGPSLAGWKSVETFKLAIRRQSLNRVLEAITLLPNLKQLMLTVARAGIDESLDQGFITSVQQPTMFKTLDLVFRASDMEDFIDTCHISSQLSIRYKTIDCYTRGPFGGVIDSIADYHPSLSVLRLYPLHRARPPRADYYTLPLAIPLEDYKVDVYMLEPVVRLVNLTSICLLPGLRITLTNDLLHTLAGSCPNLEDCYFNPLVRIESESSILLWNISLSDVIQFAARCEKLKHLGILFDARKPNQDRSRGTESSSSLVSLDYGESTLDDVYYAYAMLEAGSLL